MPNEPAERASDSLTPIASEGPTVDFVIPVHNEATELAAHVSELRRYLDTDFPFDYVITIADNASTDDTYAIATTLATTPNVRVLHVDEKGRGRALKAAWLTSTSPVVAYMDVDLSTDLDAILPLVAPLISGHSDIAIGSRLAAGSSVARAPKREFISRSYNLILRTMFATQIRDAQCGFKAIRRDVAVALLPNIEDNDWFFDTELLLVAERNGLRIHQVPVDWIDDPDSRVDVKQTAIADLRGAVRVAKTFARGAGRIDLADVERAQLTDDFGRRLVSFAAIGAMSTAVSLALVLMLHNRLGIIAANGIAVSATFVFNTFANARYTFGTRRGTWKPALYAYVAALTLTSAALAVVSALHVGFSLQLATLITMWAVSTAVRFSLIQHRSRRVITEGRS